MSGYYKIEGENQFAFFRANFNQIRQIITRDPDWVTNVVKVNQDPSWAVSAVKFNKAITGTNIVEEGQNYFVVRGSQYFFYKIEAIDANTSRITPEGRIWGYLKFAIPFGLFMSCIIPVVLTPLIFSLRRKAAENQSKSYLEAFCKYLEIRQKHLQNQSYQRGMGQGSKSHKQT